jgi:hypothetical protein
MPEMNEQKFKTVIEKYCPVVQHNVAFEVLRLGHIDLGSNCLHTHDCERDRGGCTNRILGAKSGNTTENTGR